MLSYCLNCNKDTESINPNSQKPAIKNITYIPLLDDTPF